MVDLTDIRLLFFRAQLEVSNRISVEIQHRQMTHHDPKPNKPSSRIHKFSNVEPFVLTSEAFDPDVRTRIREAEVLAKKNSSI